ncbi:MAG: hypothetical protein Q9167_002161 [Letrouitia subvulpina]
MLIVNAARDGSYTFSRNKGPETGNVTAFLRTQDWGIDEPNWPPKVYQFWPTRSTEPTYPVPIWIWQRAVVLDHEGYPMLDFKDLPATISSHEDGSILEGIVREDPRITDRDIAVRMPWGDSNTRMEPVVDPETVGLKRSTFRHNAGCINWQERQPEEALASPFVSTAGGLSGMDSGEWPLEQPIVPDPLPLVSTVGSYPGMASGEWILSQPVVPGPLPLVSTVGSYSGMASGEWLLAQPVVPDPLPFFFTVQGFSGMASEEWLLAQPVEPNPMLTTQISGFGTTEDAIERDVEFAEFLNPYLNPFDPFTPE